MNHARIRASDLASPRQQRNWDWRAAANFIAGGAGGGLLLFTALVGASADVIRVATLLGLMLIGGGLTCVWFEIGRPWRAMNVYRHFSSSWMTREAVVALGVFAAGSFAMLTLASPLVVLAGLFGLAFLYCQARILAANKGIPTWRHPRSIGLMIVTGLAEGAGFLACVAVLSSMPIGTWTLFSMLILIALRAYIWRHYLAGVRHGGAPDAALQVLGGFAARFVLIGHVVPALLVVAALAGMPGQGGLVFGAGLMVVAAGWMLKYTLVRRAAFTQGLSVLRLPVRGSGPSGPTAKPGWKAAVGVSVAQ